MGATDTLIHSDKVSEMDDSKKRKLSDAEGDLVDKRPKDDTSDSDNSVHKLTSLFDRPFNRDVIRDLEDEDYTSYSEKSDVLTTLITYFESRDKRFCFKCAASELKFLDQSSCFVHSFPIIELSEFKGLIGDDTLMCGKCGLSLYVIVDDTEARVKYELDK